MAYFGQMWETVDGEPIYEYFIPQVTSKDILSKLGNEVWERRMCWAADVRWQHIWMTRCTWSAVVRHNTNDTLDRFKVDVSAELCNICRGKGHSWKAKIWNGRPFLVPGGQRMPKGDHWKNPDFCNDCRGSGLKDE